MRSAFLYLCSILLWACNSRQPEPAQSLRTGPAILGLASPVHLQYDSTRVFMLDYFKTPPHPDSISIEPKLPLTFAADSAILTIKGNLPQALGRLNIVYGGAHYSIPVFRNDKVAFNYTYTASSPHVQSVQLKGSFNGWNASATPLQRSDNTWSRTLILQPGAYSYRVVEDGNEMLDKNNSRTRDNGSGGLNSVWQVGEFKKQPLVTSFAQRGDSLVALYPATLDEPLILWENSHLDSSRWVRRSDRLSIAIPQEAASLERSHIRLYSQSGLQRGNDLLIPLQFGKAVTDPALLTRRDKHRYAMYFMMVDRFVNGDTTIDQPLDDPSVLPIANFYGGDLQGVKQRLADGYIKDLGLNVVWLSPITQNPLTAYGLWDKGGVRTTFSGYHGYWPISSSAVDFRFGTAADLKEVIETAHQSDLAVLLDYVANHVHEEHPLYRAHPDWATDLYLPDGSLNTERWDEYRLTTWFDTFMPTLDFGKPQVVEAMTDSALYWFKNFQLDGFRHDATKHIPVEFWRTLTRKLKYEVALPQDRSIYQIGETYGNPELIASYIGSGLLDAQFDFNLYDAAVAAFSANSADFSNLRQVLEQSLYTYGSHHLMGNISGNQDRTRFISYADGSVRFSEDAKLAGYLRDIEVSDTTAYRKLAALHAFNFTIPGVPVIYYGDEIGMPGANDPDNRRMMRFGEQLSAREKTMLRETKEIGHLRQENLALLYGDTQVFDVPKTALAYQRRYLGQSVIACFNMSPETQILELELDPAAAALSYAAFKSYPFSLQGSQLRVHLPPYSYQLLSSTP